jgi:hypothetical protein
MGQNNFAARRVGGGQGHQSLPERPKKIQAFFQVLHAREESQKPR